MTPTLTQPSSRPVIGVGTFILSLFLVAIVSQKRELQRVQIERDVAVSRAREFKLAFEQEHKKRALQYMLLQSISHERDTVAKEKTAITQKAVKATTNGTPNIVAVTEPTTPLTARGRAAEPNPAP